MYSHTHAHRVCMHEAVLFTAQFATKGLTGASSEGFHVREGRCWRLGALT